MKDIKIDYIPAWDFRSPNKEVKDTSAGAIAASGMLELSQFDENGSYYRENAIKILSALTEKYSTYEEGCTDMTQGNWLACHVHRC